MSDVAWGMLFTWLTLVAKAIIDEARERRKAREAKELKKAVEVNTEVTVAKAEGLYKKVDSAEKNVTDQATEAAKVATKAVTESVFATHKQNEQIKSLAKTVDKFNGGPGGFHEITDRLGKLEDGHAEVKQDVKDIKEAFGGVVKSIDHLSQSIQDRKMV